MTPTKPTFSFSRAVAGMQWLLGRDWRLVFRLTLIWITVDTVLYTLDALIGAAPDALLLTFTTLSAPIFVGTITILALDPDNRGIGAASSLAIARYVPLLILSLLTAIGAVIGFVLLILPGIAIMVLWAVANQVMLNEGRGPIASLRVSFAMTKGHFWPILGLLLLYLLTFVVINAAGEVVSSNAFSGSEVLRTLLSTVTQVSVSVLGIYITTSIYLELRYGDQPDIGAFD